MFARSFYAAVTAVEAVLASTLSHHQPQQCRVGPGKTIPNLHAVALEL